MSAKSGQTVSFDSCFSFTIQLYLLLPYCWLKVKLNVKQVIAVQVHNTALFVVAILLVKG